jgi:hypothetical protein
MDMAARRAPRIVYGGRTSQERRQAALGVFQDQGICEVSGGRVSALRLFEGLAVAFTFSGAAPNLLDLSRVRFMP